MWQTPRLTIRRFRSDDWRDLHELQGDPEATKFVGGVWAPEKTREVVGGIIDAYPRKALEWLAVADRSTDRVVGACWLGELSPRWCDALGWEAEIELGYRFARSHWNRGYATEAAQAMLRRGLRELSLPSVVAIVDVRNGASQRVIQKLGMTLEARGVQEGVTLHGYRMGRDSFAAL